MLHKPGLGNMVRVGVHEIMQKASIMSTMRFKGTGTLAQRLMIEKKVAISNYYISIGII